MSDLDGAWYEAEDAAGHARYDAQLSRADLTPITPAPGAWVVESQWRKHADGYEPGPLRQSCRDRADASRLGMSLACCAGALSVRVASADGAICESWDREGNYWLTHDRSPSLLSKADTANGEKLRAVFPEVWGELQARYNAPGAFLPDDPDLAQAGLLKEDT